MSVTVSRDPRGVRVLVVAPGPQGVRGPEGKQGPVGPMPVVGTAAERDVPEQGQDATSAQVVLGSDTRLTDARTPRAHTHPVAEVAGLNTALAGKAASVHQHVAAEVTDLGSAAKCSVPGTGADAAAGEVVLGRDTRLTNSRTPTAHAATHQPGTGSDPLPGLARVTHPNGTDLLVEHWDGDRWVVTVYNSGWRDISALLEPGWTGTVLVRRDATDLVVHVSPLAFTAAAASDVFWRPPSGWGFGGMPGGESRFGSIPDGSASTRWAAVTLQAGVGLTVKRSLGNAAPGVNHWGSVRGAVTPAIPTSLPGVAAKMMTSDDPMTLPARGLM